MSMHNAQMSHRLTIALISTTFSVISGTGSARAQSAEAESLFGDGNKLMAVGKLAEACAAFEASNRIESRAGTLLRLGECRENNRQLASAWSAYKDARNLAVDPRKRKLATTRIAALEPRLSNLTVTVSEQDRAPGLVLTRNGMEFEPMLWNRALPVDGGDYVLAAEAPGYEAWQKTIHVPVEGAKLSVEVLPLTKASAEEPPPALTSSNSPVHDQPSAPLQTVTKVSSSPVLSPMPPRIERHAPGTTQSRSLFTMRRKIAISVWAVSVIGVTTGSVLGTLAKAKQNDAFTRCPDPVMPCKQAEQANELIQSSHRQALEANVAFIIASAAVIGAGVLWFTGAPDDENTTRVGIFPSLAPGGMNISLMGRL